MFKIFSTYFVEQIYKMQLWRLAVRYGTYSWH